MKQNEEVNYTQAFEELQNIVAQLESEKISVDEIALKIKRATLLISVCKKKLYETEKEVEGLLGDLE